MAKEVWIIGVDPPCPRCDLTRQRVERINEETGSSVKVRDLTYTDSEAREFAVSIGKEPGTAKHVAEKAGIHMDWDYVYSVVKDPPSQPEDYDKVDGIARFWSPEMDEALRPCQEKADAAGILMTPILIVDEEVKHHGSVPPIEKIRLWLS